MCSQFGCNFWHWELEYVGYLIENNYLRGDDAVDALGWAEERREELELRKQGASVTRVQGQELQLLYILAELRTMVVVMKMVVGLLAVMSSI